ncbi:MAG: hypothetical protein JXB45_12980, partial [Candidatus Krumholzibacteriota bacterium]|nr:hypothetical protein [Candidatus Krumholzibacteriota bacterium]
MIVMLAVFLLGGMYSAAFAGDKTGIKINEIIPDNLSATSLTSGLIVQSVSCPYDTLAAMQTGIPFTILLKNLSDVEIKIQFMILNFSFASTGDRNSDYLVTGVSSPDSIMPPHVTRVFKFEIEVLPWALANVDISVMVFVVGERLDNHQPVFTESEEQLYTLDHFNMASFDNDDGTYRWRGGWVEIGESDGPGEGNIQIVEPLSSAVIGDHVPYTGAGLSRGADIYGADNAELEFLWERDPVNGFEGSFLVQVSKNGRDDWETLLTIAGGADESYTSEAFIIDDHISDSTTVRFMTEGVCSGRMFVDEVRIILITQSSFHSWTVLSEAILFHAALFDTRHTPDRSDDSLICVTNPEVVSLDRIQYLYGKQPLADIPFEKSNLYRLVIQFNSSYDWDWKPDESETGYLSFTGLNRGFGRLSAPRFGCKEFLLPETMIPDQEDDPADYLVGATEKSLPPIPWSMNTDPWLDPVVDEGKVDEFGAVMEGLDPLRWIVDCRDAGKNWEITGNCEKERYYFHEIWFQPDLEWAHADTADLFLHINGKEPDENLEQIHLLLNMMDDDVEGPVISDYSPEILPEGVSEYITCRITDPSGVYDDGTGVGGQGVYLLYDSDGSLEDDFYELQMSPAGGGYFRSDLTVGGLSQGEELIYRVYACDDDSDTGPADRSRSRGDIQTVQFVGSEPVHDAPYSLSPNFVYPGQQDVTFSIKIGNPNSGKVTFLPAVSYLRIDDGTTVLVTHLSNETVLSPGAVDFPIAFDPVDFPVDFSALDTLKPLLHLEGTYLDSLSWDQTWTVSVSNRLTVKRPTLHMEAHALPSPDVNPGESKVELLRLELNLENVTGILLDTLIVSNPRARVPGGAASDANFERLYLYKQGAPLLESLAAPDDSEPPFLTSRPFTESDSLLAAATLDKGRAVFGLSRGRLIPPWESLYYYVVADVDSFSASDGEFLDIDIASPDSVFLSGSAAVSFEELPLNSEGRNRIDGFVSFQAQIVDNLPDTLYSGDGNQPVFTVDLPSNGQLPDILSGLSVRNLGDSQVDEIINDLRFWADDGDGVFSAGEDEYLGILLYTGARFQISGISRPVMGSQRFFLTAGFGQGFTEPLEVRFGIPVGGVEYISGNDGPLDQGVIAVSSQVLIRRESIIVEALESGSGSVTVHPGEVDVELLGLRIVNNTLGEVTVDSLRLRSAEGLFACESAKNFGLFHDNGNLTFDPAGDAWISSAAWSAGSGLFADMDLHVAAGSSAVLFVATGLDSFKTADGCTLAVWLASAADLHLSAATENPYEIDG